jgi:hypothetical protein
VFLSSTPSNKTIGFQVVLCNIFSIISMGSVEMRIAASIMERI